MDDDRKIWETWAGALQRWGLDELVATFLEALGPLTILGAQVVYLGQPLLAPLIPNRHLDAAAQVLEDMDTARTFIAFLREAA